MKVQYKKLYRDAQAPERAHSTDAGADLFAHSVTVDKYGNMSIGTGIAVDIPEGYVGLLFARSSICKKELLLSNGVGVIDSGYIGEIIVKLKPARGFMGLIERLYASISGEYITYERGDKCAQLVIVPIPNVELDEVDILQGGERGAGGHGSTGN